MEGETKHHQVDSCPSRREVTKAGETRLTRAKLHGDSHDVRVGKCADLSRRLLYVNKALYMAEVAPDTDRRTDGRTKPLKQIFFVQTKIFGHFPFNSHAMPSEEAEQSICLNNVYGCIWEMVLQGSNGDEEPFRTRDSRLMNQHS